MSDHHLLATYRQATIRAEIERHRIDQITTDTPTTPGAIPGDPWGLRGVPVVGVIGGVGGASPGTKPGTGPLFA